MSVYDRIELVRDVLSADKKTAFDIELCYALVLNSAKKLETQKTIEEVIKINVDNLAVLCNRQVVMSIIQKINITSMDNVATNKLQSLIILYTNLAQKGAKGIKIGNETYKLLVEQVEKVTGNEFKPLTEVRFSDVLRAKSNFRTKVEKPAEPEEPERDTTIPDCWTKELLETYNSISNKDRELASSISLPEQFRELGVHFTNISYSDVDMTKDIDNKFIESIGELAMRTILSNDSLSVRLAIEDVRELIRNGLGERIPLKLSKTITEQLGDRMELNKLLRKIFAINQENLDAQKNGIKILLTLAYAPIAEYDAYIKRFSN